MSKISITPSATGTGVFTIASPATSTDRTLTLPDEAGSIVVNTATGIDVTGTVTADGLDVSSASGSLVAKFATNDATAANNAGMHIYNYASATAASRHSDLIFDPSGANASGGDYLIISAKGDNSASIINYHATSTLALGTAGLERLKISSSGKVGIGTSSPATKLNIENAGACQLQMAYSSTIFGRVGRLSSGDYEFSSYENGGNLLFGTTTTNGSTTERMRINSSGDLLVGTTNATGRIVSNTTGAYPFVARNGGGTSGYFGLIEFRNNADNAAVGSVVRVNDNSTAYNTTSDYRLKTDAQPMTGASERVLALKPVNFEWISDGSRVDGFLAHEAQAVVPECVTGTKDAMRDEEYEVTAAVYEDIIIAAVLDEEGNELEAERTEQRLVTEAVMGTRSVPDYQGIDQSKLVPLLTAALQEALTEISALKVRVAALEAV